MSAAVPPQARTEQWREMQPGAARARTGSPGPHALPLPIDRRPDVAGPRRAGGARDLEGRRRPVTSTALRLPDGTPKRTTLTAPDIALIPRGRLVHGRSDDARVRGFCGRVLAVGPDDTPRDERSLYLVDDKYCFSGDSMYWSRMTSSDAKLAAPTSRQTMCVRAAPIRFASRGSAKAASAATPL